MTDNEKFDVIAEVRQIKKQIEGFMLTAHDMQTHIKQGEWWRGAVLGVILALLVEIFGIFYFAGKITRTIEVNSGRIQCLEEIHPRTN